ncbi:MAG: N-acetyltransferase family protein [Steroidobacteraceae bacterium]
MSFQLIDCTPDAHAAAVREIFNDAILNTTALYDYKPRSHDTVVQWFGDKASACHPVIGAINAQGVLCGFATYGSFRPRAAYKYSVEHSVYVHPAWQRQGLGRLLLQAVIARATEAGFHAMIGGIDADNRASILLHEQFGFAHVGTIRQAAWKFGRWLDLAFYQLLLPGPNQPTED